MQNFYDLFGVSRDATPRDITRAYRQRALRAHTDRGGNLNDIQQLNEGYHALLDPERRAELDAQYDEMRASGDRNLEAVIVDGYLETNGEAFSEKYKRLHTDLMQRYQTTPLVKENSARAHLQTINTTMNFFLTPPVAGLRGVMSNDFTINTLNQLTAYAILARDAEFPSLLSFFESTAYRRASWHAICQNLKYIAEGHAEEEINAWLPRFDGERKTEAEVASVRQQFIHEDIGRDQERRRLNAQLREARLLHRYEKDINTYFHEESVRETAYQVLNWIPALAGKVDKEVLVNLFLRAASLFQHSSLRGVNDEEQMADQVLAYALLENAYIYARDMSPYFELSTLIPILKCMSTFSYALPEMTHNFKAYMHRAEILVDVFPFCAAIESNIDLSHRHSDTLMWMRKYLNALLAKANTHPTSLHIAKEKVLYYAYEGLLNHWLSPVDDPEVTMQLRLNLMLALLEKEGQNFNHVTQLLSAPTVFVDRDEAGWMRRDRGLPIPNLPALGQFKSLDGMEFNHNTGEIKFQLTPWNSSMPVHDKLFTLADLGELFSKNLGSAFFSLEQADPNMRFHPFNTMYFGPAALESTSLIQTMFLTDYILKFLTISQEVQGQYPYAFRYIDVLLDGLPAHLQAIVYEFHTAPQHEHAAHRFWIEAMETDYAIKQSDYGYSQTTRAVVPEVKMVVKKHALKRDARGNQIDTENDKEGWPLFIIQREEHENLQAALAALEGDAIIFFKEEGVIWVNIWEAGELSTDKELPEESLASFSFLEQTRSATGKIEVNTENASIVYALTRQVASALGKAHRFTPEYVFTQALTEHYTEFSQYFPEFARLRAFSQIMIFVRLLEHAYETNKAGIISIETVLNNVTVWNNKRSNVEENRRVNEQSYRAQFASGKSENISMLQEYFVKLRENVSEPKFYAELVTHLQSMANDRRTLHQDSFEIKNAVESLFKENENLIIKEHDYATWSRSKDGIYREIQGLRERWVKEGNLERKNDLISFLKSVLPSESSWVIERFVSRMMDYGDVSELATLLAKNKYEQAVSNESASYPFSVGVSEIKAILECNASVDELAERLTSRQFSKFSQSIAENYQNEMNEISSQQSELRDQLRRRRQFEENLIALGVHVEHEDENDRSGMPPLWVPSSMSQEIRDGHHRLVFGGVSLRQNVNRMESADADNAIDRVFNTRDSYESKTSHDVITGRQFFQQNPPGKLAELAQEQWAEEARKKIPAEERRQEALRQQEIQRQQEEERKRIAAEAQARQLKQEADERVRQQKLVKERRQAEENERVRQHIERKKFFTQSEDISSGTSRRTPINTQVIDRTIASSEHFETAQDLSSRYNFIDTYVEGLGIIVEEDQLFHQYITDEQGNTRRHLRTIFYPADILKGWPEIRAADYLIRKARASGKEYLIKRLKDKGVQETDGTQGSDVQGGILSTKLADKRYDRLRAVIMGANPYYVSNTSANRITLFRDAVSDVLSDYKKHFSIKHSKESADFLKKWKQFISNSTTSGRLDHFIKVMSELMQKKNSTPQESRLRDSLLTLWHTGLYLMAGEECYLEKLIDESTQFLAIPLYPVESRTAHPQSHDTIGSYLLRILVERNHAAKIPTLLAKGIEPAIDVMLPIGMRSLGEKSRIEATKQQKIEKQQQAKIRRQKEVRNQTYQREEQRFALQREAAKTAFLEQRHNHFHISSYTLVTDSVNTKVVHKMKMLSKKAESSNITASQAAREKSEEAYIEGLSFMAQDSELFYQYITDDYGNLQRHLRAIFYPANATRHWPDICAADYLIRSIQRFGRADLLEALQERGIVSHIPLQKDYLATRWGKAFGESSLQAELKTRLSEYRSRFSSWRSKESRKIVKNLTSISENSSGFDMVTFVATISELMLFKDVIEKPSRLLNTLLDCWHTAIYLLVTEVSEEVFNRLLEQHHDTLSAPLYPAEMRTLHPWSQDTVGSYLLRIAVEKNNTSQIMTLLRKNIEPARDVLLPLKFKSKKQKFRLEEERQKASEQQAVERQYQIDQRQRTQLREEQQRQAACDAMEQDWQRKTERSRYQADRSRAADEATRQRAQQRIQAEQERQQQEEIRQDEIKNQNEEMQRILAREKLATEKVTMAEKRFTEQGINTGRAWAEERQGITRLTYNTSKKNEPVVDQEPEQEVILFDNDATVLTLTHDHWFASPLIGSEKPDNHQPQKEKTQLAEEQEDWANQHRFMKEARAKQRAVDYKKFRERWHQYHGIIRKEKNQRVENLRSKTEQEEIADLFLFSSAKIRQTQSKRDSRSANDVADIGKPPASPPPMKAEGSGGDSSSSSSESSDEGSVVSLGDSKVTMYKRRKVKGHSLHDMSDALRHRVILALQEAGILDVNERLTEEAIQNSDLAMKKGKMLINKTVTTELTKNGSKIEDWEKRKTVIVTLSSGQRVEVHFYKNKVTEKVNYTHHDFKVKNPVSATMIDGMKYKEGQLEELFKLRK